MPDQEVFACGICGKTLKMDTVTVTEVERLDRKTGEMVKRRVNILAPNDGGYADERNHFCKQCTTERLGIKATRPA